LELWTPTQSELGDLVETDRNACRRSVAKGLLARRLRSYCDDNAVPLDGVTKATIDDLTSKSKTDYETFLSNLKGKPTLIDSLLFEGVVTPVPEGA
jgi:hypothetical protein